MKATANYWNTSNSFFYIKAVYKIIKNFEIPCS